MFALVVSSMNGGVRAIQCWGKAVFAEEVDIRFDTRTLILLILDDLDFLEIERHRV